jgi:hypothetical protein
MQCCDRVIRVRHPEKFREEKAESGILTRKAGFGTGKRNLVSRRVAAVEMERIGV